MYWNNSFSFLFIEFSILFTSIKEYLLISTNLTEAPVLTIAVTVGTAVFEVVITSSPGPISKAFSAIVIASVQFPTPIPNLQS